MPQEDYPNHVTKGCGVGCHVGRYPYPTCWMSDMGHHVGCKIPHQVGCLVGHQRGMSHIMTWLRNIQTMSTLCHPTPRQPHPMLDIILAWVIWDMPWDVMWEMTWDLACGI